MSLTGVISLFLTCSLSAATFWVSPDGDDMAAGTRDHPWATPQHAVTAVMAGDTVYFRHGTYALDGPILPRVSGTAEAPITLAGYPGESAIFDGSGFHHADETYKKGLLHLEGVVHYALKNLHVRNSWHGFGIKVSGHASHIDILECTSAETFGPGIGFWNSEFIRVMYCEVTGANTNRRRVYGDPTTQAAHEGISSGGSRHFEIAYNHVHHCDKEGIDVKEASAHGTVHHNYVHHLPRQGLYADAWFGLLENVTFHHNVVHDCEWGVAINTEGVGADLRGVAVHHNLLHDNRGSGIHSGLWGVNGPRSDLLIAHNTLYANGSAGQYSGPTGNIDIRSPQSQRVRVFNNLCVAGGTFELGAFADAATPAGAALLAAREVSFSHNFIGQFVPISATDVAGITPRQRERYHRAYALAGDNPVFGHAELQDPDRGNFWLGATSAARRAGLIDPEFHGLGQTEPPDLGAFDFGQDLIPLPAPAIEHILDDVWRVVHRTQPGRATIRQRSDDQGETWTSAAVPAVGQGIPDIHYFRHSDNAPFPQFRYTVVTDPAERVRFKHL
ncbi:right-handed parallel beta-helix repeat-containing protein [Synoicihabitans lomoniglobus]|uniref:right-handed parallel beta-helix repeat-containing protein n=1 Tax=Synoicihabitans lomoniglobus TaxID=2909285 RepID=UPI002ED3BECF|nr:right-handed parallel beta-helix repeat-containing protein [Opitutaceae bacterium LMO-M01]